MQRSGFSAFARYVPDWTSYVLCSLTYVVFWALLSDQGSPFTSLLVNSWEYHIFDKHTLSSLLLLLTRTLSTITLRDLMIGGGHSGCCIFFLKPGSGAAGYRSPYLSHAKRALYHLSYSPDDSWTALTSYLSPGWCNLHWTGDHAPHWTIPRAGTCARMYRYLDSAARRRPTVWGLCGNACTGGSRRKFFFCSTNKYFFRVFLWPWKYTFEWYSNCWGCCRNLHFFAFGGQIIPSGF